MKSFGNLLKEYIKQQGYTIYQIAKETEIDRSFLQGVLTEKRKLPQKRFSDIVNLSFFTPTQVKNLCNLYYLEKYGKEKIERLNKIEQGFKGEIKKEISSPYTLEFKHINDKISFLSNRAEILQVMHTALNTNENECFKSNFSFDDLDINRIVYQACSQRKIKNFFHFTNKNDGSDCHNINILFNSLCYAEEGYYTYISNKNFAFSNLMPYFFFCDKYFIQYDQKCDNAIVFDSKLIKNYLDNTIVEIKQNMDKKVFIKEDAFESQKLIQMITANNKHKTSVSFDNAVGAFFLTSEIIESIATEKIKSIPGIIQHLQSHFAIMLGSDHKSFTNLYLTYEAVSNFVETGRIPCFPSIYAKNVPSHLRSQLLNNLLDFAKDNTLQITNPQTLPIKYNITAQIGDNNLIVTTCNDLNNPNEHQGKIIYHTDDKLIVDDFLDYYNYISLSEKTFSPNISRQIIQAFVDQLEAMN